MQKSDRYCATALILLTLAIFFLGVMAFSWNPLSLLGLVSICIGILLTLGCILYFALYAHALKQETKQSEAHT